MKQGVIGLAAAFGVGVVVTAGVALWLVGDEKGEQPNASAAQPAPPKPADARPVLPPQARRAAEEGPGASAQVEAELEQRGEAQTPPAEAHYTVAEKYENEKLSEIPYKMVGAWDDAPEEQVAGRHRSFVLVVDPGMTDRQLESLARDVRRVNEDADRLDVRIYDSEEAAKGEKGRYTSQVAQVTRHRGLNVDVIRVRGRVVEP